VRFLINEDHLVIDKSLITGSIPSELGNLSALTRLSISDALLTGTISSEFARLTNLGMFFMTVFESPRTLPLTVSLQNICHFLASAA
jgi:hypothetical protein